MKPTLKKCLELHLIEKAKTGGQIVPASAWLDSTMREGSICVQPLAGIQMSPS
jgi:hypothetical protein